MTCRASPQLLCPLPLAHAAQRRWQLDSAVLPVAKDDGPESLEREPELGRDGEALLGALALCHRCGSPLAILDLQQCDQAGVEAERPRDDPLARDRKVSAQYEVEWEEAGGRRLLEDLLRAGPRRGEGWGVECELRATLRNAY